MPRFDLGMCAESESNEKYGKAQQKLHVVLQCDDLSASMICPQILDSNDGKVVFQVVFSVRVKGKSS